MEPTRAYLPPALEEGRAWGFGLNLYALRSRRNWGIGDFTDLRDFVAYAAGEGADVVGVNPLHALHYAEPEAASPYSPSSRYFLNPLYIDVEGVPEFADDGKHARALRERVGSAQFGEALAALRDADAVAYGGVARAKFFALSELFAIFRERGGERAEVFSAFVARGGQRLERFALYEALTEHFAQSGGARGWLTWPDAYRRPESDAVRKFARSSRRRVEYFTYLQWVASEQLAAAAVAASGMSIGLYLDIAVGADANGADVWSNPEAYALDETIGAPPDSLGPGGQNWGLPVPRPGALLHGGGASFAELLAANMAHAGALRIDHVMALQRLFCIPRGKRAAEGAYAAYPFEELLAVAAAASVTARCLIVGEDLGTVPEGFRERLDREGIFSYRLLLFERDDDGRFRAPSAYPERALATATTHDLPTLGGWCIGRDIETRVRTGSLPPEEAAESHAVRRVDVSRLLDSLLEHGALDRAGFDALHRAIDERRPEAADYAELTRGAYRYLAASRARLVLIQLDDATGEFDQVNVPGTSAEYPNWRRKNGLDLGDIATDPRIAALAADVRSRVKGGASR
jgi:4-alpha-glucanotransferase